MNFARYSKMSNRQKMRAGLRGFAMSNCGLDVSDSQTGAALGTLQLRHFGGLGQEGIFSAQEVPAEPTFTIIPLPLPELRRAAPPVPLVEPEPAHIVAAPVEPAPVAPPPVTLSVLTPVSTFAPPEPEPAPVAPPPVTLSVLTPVSTFAPPEPVIERKSEEPTEAVIAAAKSEFEARKAAEVLERALEDERRANAEVAKRFEVSQEEMKEIFDRAIKAGLKPQEAAGVVQNVVQQKAAQAKSKGPVRDIRDPGRPPLVDLSKSPEERQAQLDQFLALQKKEAMGVGGQGGFFSTPIAVLPIIGPVTPVGAAIGGFGIWAIFKLLRGGF